MWFWLCIILGWIILSFPLGILVAKIFKLPESSCTGNCNQGRSCTCMEKKND